MAARLAHRFGASKYTSVHQRRAVFAARIGANTGSGATPPLVVVQNLPILNAATPTFCRYAMAPER